MNLAACRTHEPVSLPRHRAGHPVRDVAIAQEILPFPPAPSASKAGLTMEDSTYKKRVEPKHLEECAEHPDHPDGRCRAGYALDLRW